MNGNQNQPGQENNWPANQKEQADEGQLSPPPSREIDMRTMESDARSIERGDAAPTPESVLPPADEKEPVFRPETQVADSFDMDAEAGKGKSKKGLIIIISLVIIIAAAAAAYFIFFASKSENGTPPPPPPPPAVTPPPPPRLLHNSLLLPRPQSVSEIRLTSLLLTQITSALQILPKLGNGELREIVVSDSSGSQVKFSEFMAAFLTDFSASQLAQWFEDDFTAFLYYDQNGTWPGYAVKIKLGINIQEIKSNLRSSENPGTTARFYLTPPGSFSQFKDGKINTTPTRYAVGSSKGASFNYLLTNNYLVVGTSFEGLKKAAPLLGI